MENPTKTLIKPQKPTINCAIYARKSCEEGLEQEFNSLDAQYEAGKSIAIKSVLRWKWSEYIKNIRRQIEEKTYNIANTYTT